MMNRELLHELYEDKAVQRLKLQERLVNEKYPSKELLDKDMKKYISLKNEMIEIKKFVQEWE